MQHRELAFRYHHEVIKAEFSQLESLLKAILFAAIIEGRSGAAAVIKQNKAELTKSRQWFTTFASQMKHGWMIRQRSPQLERKGEKVLYQKLTGYTIAEHVSASSDRAELGSELSQAQFMVLVTLGFLYKLKTVNFQVLQRIDNLGGDSDLAKELSSWQFNWQPETVFNQLNWISQTAELTFTETYELVLKYPHQFLKFAHFVSAFLVASDERSAQLELALQTKKIQSDDGYKPPFTILLPNGMVIEPPAEKTEEERDPFTYNGTVPSAFFDLIQDIEM
jgi:hypothetical protein